MRFCRVTESRNSSSGVEEKARVEVAIPAAAPVRVMRVVFVVEFESIVCVVDNIVVIAAACGTKAVWRTWRKDPAATILIHDMV